MEENKSRQVEESQPQEALHRLVYLTELQLCEVYNSVNCYKWHDLLGSKPKEFDSLPDLKVFGMDRRRYLKPVIDAINAMVTEKELIRYHHIHNLDRSDREFEIWWRRKKIMEATGILLNPAEVPRKESSNKGSCNSEEES